MEAVAAVANVLAVANVAASVTETAEVVLDARSEVVVMLAKVADTGFNEELDALSAETVVELVTDGTAVLDIVNVVAGRDRGGPEPLNAGGDDREAPDLLPEGATGDKADEIEVADGGTTDVVEARTALDPPVRLAESVVALTDAKIDARDELSEKEGEDEDKEEGRLGVYVEAVTAEVASIVVDKDIAEVVDAVKSSTETDETAEDDAMLVLDVESVDALVVEGAKATCSVGCTQTV